MKTVDVDRERIEGAWKGRISGCRLGVVIELLSMFKGSQAVAEYLKLNGASPLRDYVPLSDEPLVNVMGRTSCKGYVGRFEPDDDINYTVLALMMLEEHGTALTTQNVAVSWLRYLPAGYTFTAERAAYRTLLDITDSTAIVGLPPDFDLSECARNEFSEWIGAQIRADMYGWVCPGHPALAADLAKRDAALSHTGEGVNGAVFVAATAAAIPVTDSLEEAIEAGLEQVPANSAVAEAVSFARSLVGRENAVETLRERYGALSPVHTVNNLALVVWGLLAGQNDFSAAIGDTVAAGWDTDCNGATVGGLWGLTGKPIPKHWTHPWIGRAAVNIAGVGELDVNDLVDRTVQTANKIKLEVSNEI